MDALTRLALFLFSHAAVAVNDADGTTTLLLRIPLPGVKVDKTFSGRHGHLTVVEMAEEGGTR